MVTQNVKKSRPAAQLKTLKGTRDWFGSDILLRDHILYVLRAVALVEANQRLTGSSSRARPSAKSSNATAAFL